MNIKEIARTANVSISTVSLVLNNKPGVKSETRERVVHLLHQNGYELKAPAARQGVIGNLLFVRYRGSGRLMEVKDDFFIQILDGVENQARRMSFNLSIANAGSDNLAEVLAGAENTAAGVILFATEFEPGNAALLESCPVPLVVLDEDFPNEPINTIGVDNMGAIFTGVSYLHALGHTDIGYLHSTEHTGAIPERERGYRAAMAQLGLPVAEEHIFMLDLFMSKVYQQMNEILEHKPSLPTALIADNDILAVGAMRALQDHGYRVPDDLSILGFDDSYVCSVANPALSTLRSPKAAIGQQAVKRIKDMIDDPGGSAMKSRLCVRLMKRGTTAPPPGREKDP